MQMRVAAAAREAVPGRGYGEPVESASLLLAPHLVL